MKIGASLIVMCATVFWSFGSWSTPRLPLPKDAFVLTVYEMLCGSVWLLLFASVRGEHVLPTSAPLDAWLAWAYLVTFGSVVAFTAYVWVLSVAPISLVATYAYVNPVVAVFLGWLILSEAVTLADRRRRPRRGRGGGGRGVGRATAEPGWRAAVACPEAD